MTFNKIFIFGNVGKDPIIKHYDSEKVMANFSVATTDRVKDQNGNFSDKTEWFNVSCWGQQANFVESYVRRGTPIFVDGRLRTREYTDQSGQVRSSLDVSANSVQLIGGGGGGRRADAPSAPKQDIPIAPPVDISAGDTTDDLPF